MNAIVHNFEIQAPAKRTREATLERKLKTAEAKLARTQAQVKTMRQALRAMAYTYAQLSSTNTMLRAVLRNSRARNLDQGAIDMICNCAPSRTQAFAAARRR